MTESAKIKTIIQFLLLCVVVIGLSYFVTSTWVQKKETIPEKQSLVFEKSMTLAEFGRTNNLSNEMLQKVFELKDKEAQQRQVSDFQLTEDRITKKIEQAQAIEAEHGSKNWQKIVVKFILWFVILGTSFYLLRKGKILPGMRKILYLISLTVFGVILGADPSAMGTVKDAIVLFAGKGVICPPRMIALTLFLLLVFLANKFFCAWGCQLGTLQDLIFRINRNKKDRKGIFRQVKLPFVVTNTIRIAFFILFTIIAFAWTVDIVDLIDPFKIFKPAMIGVSGWVFLIVMLVASLFVYRPWCSMFCPFGLVGWLVEKRSLFKIKVNYDTCIACESCAKVCPSTVMETILKREKTISDCFSCGSCLTECPSGSITFGYGKRQLPPAGKFEKKQTAEK
ncbi:MAG: 4Fe-4S binding protein [bacterium]